MATFRLSPTSRRLQRRHVIVVGIIVEVCRKHSERSVDLCSTICMAKERRARKDLVVCPFAKIRNAWQLLVALL